MAKAEELFTDVNFECWYCKKALINGTKSPKAAEFTFQHERGEECSAQAAFRLEDKYFISSKAVAGREWLGRAAAPDTSVILVPWKEGVNIIDFTEVFDLLDTNVRDSFAAAIYEIPEWAITSNIILGFDPLWPTILQNDPRVGLVTRGFTPDFARPRIVAASDVLVVKETLVLTRSGRCGGRQTQWKVGRPRRRR
jgi:hypothetical protein